MLLDWFNTRKAVELGTSLADCYLPRTSPVASGHRVAPRSADDERDLQRLVQRVACDVHPLKLNLFKRAKLLKAFKSRLIARGFDRSTVDNLTKALLLQISGSPLSAAPPNGGMGNSSAVSPPRRIPDLARLAESDYEEAVARLQEVVAINPRDARAQSNLGAALVRVGRYDEAEQAFRSALALEPGFVDPYLHLGNLLQLRGQFVESLTVLRCAAKENPLSADALVCLGFGLGILQQMDRAKECFETALRVQPRSAAALCGAGWLAAADGRFEEAEKFYRNALEVEPNMVAAWTWLASLRRMTSADSEWLKGVERVLATRVPPLDEARLRFAMGKYFDDLGEFSRAFEQYKRGNDLYKKAVHPYDRARRTRFVDGISNLYTRQRLALAREGSCESARPVFVIGMPRSGTSLVEQIIASHPEAAGAGELDFWTEAARRHPQTVRSDLPDASTAKQVAEAYLRELSGYSADAKRVVDKATFNFNLLGLINAVFPKSHIIYLRRDPIDICLSCYFQDFTNAASMNWTWDLEDLVHYYREHHRLMEHWRSVLPQGALLDVPYSELVADPEIWSRKIIEFIGLPWSPHCLEFHQTRRAVTTASRWQVRQKIYSRSVGRWRNYQNFIRPLLELRDIA